MNKMAEKEMENTIRSFVDALGKKDMERAISFFTDDATWFTAEGTFIGRDEIKRYLAWMSKTLTDLKGTDSGVGIIIQGDKAVYQTIFESTYEGIKIKVDTVCTYEFSGDRIKNHWIISDRLSMAKQAAKGPIAKMAVNTIISRMEKGLH
jgi:ketosteroid isomerase-like protein